MSMIHTKNFELATYIQGDKTAERLALVLPGRLDTKDYAHMRGHVDFMASKGFLALSFDPPGVWESKGDISIYNTTNYLQAVDEVIAHYDNRQTLLIGHSRGAGIAMMAAMRNQHVKAFVSIFSALRAKGQWESADAEKWKEQGYLVSMRDLPPGGGPKVKEFHLPYSFYEDQLKYGSIGDSLEKSTMPKLFFLGKRDPLINPGVIKELFSIAGEPKELLELDSDHDYRMNKQLINEVNTAIGNFIEKYNI